MFVLDDLNLVFGAVKTWN